MRRAFVMMALCLGLTACGNSNASKEKTTQEETGKEVVEVLYFHGKQRCATCIAIETNTKELVQTAFAEQLKSGELVYKSVDITQEEALAEKYEVTWSSLFVVNHKNGKETTENLTKFAFSNARTAPAIFKEELSKKITKMLE